GLVVGIPREGPGHVVVARGGGAGPQGQQAAEILVVDAGGRPRQAVGPAVVESPGVVDPNGGVGPGDGVLDRAAGGVVVGVAGEGPAVGVGAGVGVGRARQVQQAGEVLVVDPGGRSGSGVGGAVVGDAVANHVDGGIGLGHDDGGGAGLV